LLFVSPLLLGLHCRMHLLFFITPVRLRERAAVTLPFPFAAATRQIHFGSRPSARELRHFS
jgi:hypothetical protein